MSIIQYLLIVLILIHLVFILLIVFDVKGVTTVFITKCRNEEISIKSEGLTSKEILYSINTRKRENSAESREKSKQSFEELSIEDRWRHLVSTVRNMWLFLHHGFLSLMKTKIPRHAKRIINYLEESGVEYYRVMWSELSHILSIEGQMGKQEKEAALLAKIVQRRIDNLQNPEHCNKTKALLCKLTNKHGLASSLHDVLWCLIKSYHENAFLLLDITNWHYEIETWENIFLPFSRSCVREQLRIIRKIHLPGVNNAGARFELTLLPSDLGPSIVKAVDEPFAWWYGQFMKYMMRPNMRFQSYLVSKKKEIGFNHPIVSIHVRRTDKIGNEAKYHDLEEYMYYVEDYYQRIELVKPKQNRKVFIATDDPKILKECVEKYRHYTCLGFSEDAVLASKHSSRYSNASLWGAILELTLLAESDFLVCTFSSGFCRLAYELMSAIHSDAPNRIQSLDVEYFYAWQRNPDRIVLYDHIPKLPSELKLYRNDVLRKKSEQAIGYEAMNGKKRDGMAEGVNVGTGVNGLFPLFKTIQYYSLKTFQHMGKETTKVE